MKKRMLRRRDFLRLAAGAATGAMLAACQPKVVEVTKIVEKPVEKIVKEVVKETIIVAGTPKVVEKEITRVVEATPKPVEAVTIRYGMWINSPTEEKLNAGYIDLFEERFPHVTVDRMFMPGGKYWEKILTLGAGGDLPEMFGVSSMYFTNLVLNGLLTPLRPLIDADPDFSMDDYSPSSFQPRHQLCHGQPYVLPMGGSPYVMFFNKTLFEQAGLKTPIEYEEEGNWDWTTYLEVSQALTKGEGGERQFGTQAHVGWSLVSDWIKSNGGETFSEDLRECLMDSPEAVEAVQFQADLLNKHQVAPSPAVQEAFGGNMFLGGKQAMVRNGIWFCAGCRTIKDFEWSCAHYPKAPGGGREYFFMPHGYGIATSTREDRREAAWEFCKFMTGDVVEKTFVESAQRMPHRKKTFEYMLKASPIPNVKVFVEPLDSAYALPLSTKYSEWNRAFNAELDLVVNDEETAKEALDKIVPQVSEIVKGAQFC